MSKSKPLKKVALLLGSNKLLARFREIYIVNKMQNYSLSSAILKHRLLNRVLHDSSKVLPPMDMMYMRLLEMEPARLGELERNESIYHATTMLS